MGEPRTVRPPHVLVLGAVYPSRAFWFHKARDRGFELFLAKEDTTFEDEFCTEIVRITPDNMDRLDELLAAIVDLDRRRGIDAIVSPYDPGILVLAHATATLGLPGPNLAHVAALRDKHAMRQRFAELGLPSAIAVSVASVVEAADAAAAIGYPVVLKPTTGVGSVGVIRVNDVAELQRAFAITHAAATLHHGPGMVLVEEYLAGDEYSMDSVIFAGEVLWRGTMGKPSPMTGPYFSEDAFAIPSQLDAGQVAELAAINDAVLAGLDFRYGVTHIEYRHDPHRGFRLLEVNPRVTGFLHPLLYQAAHGVDLVNAAYDCALGRRPTITPHPTRYAGARPLNAPTSGFFDRIEGVENARSVDGVFDVAVTARPGQAVSALPAGPQCPVGFVLACTDDYTQTQDALDKAADQLTALVGAG